MTYTSEAIFLEEWMLIFYILQGNIFHHTVQKMHMSANSLESSNLDEVQNMAHIEMLGGIMGKILLAIILMMGVLSPIISKADELTSTNYQLSTEPIGEAGSWVASTQYYLYATFGMPPVVSESIVSTPLGYSLQTIVDTSNSVSPTFTPDAPRGISAIAGNANATVTFTSPTFDGGSSIIGYSVTSIPADGTDANAGSTVLTHTITGLNNGTSYTFIVYATNTIGNSIESAVSNSVTPVAAVTTFTVTAITGSNGSVTPATQTVTQGNTTSFIVTTYTGYTASASGCGGSLAGSTYTTGAITGNCTVTATFTQNAVSANLLAGWNLLGNSINAPLDMTTAFADTTSVTTVWKWVAETSRWAFYAPSLAAANTLASYASGKGYDVLATVNGGEGFWVNAKAAFTVQLPTGTAITTSDYQPHLDTTQNKLISGWNLIATGDNISPSLFNQRLSATPPVIGVIPLNITTLWAWDSGVAKWYFYSPSLEAQGGSNLTDYITSKSYLDFTARGKMLDPTTGFWVNHP
jgi:hypothetical protein